MGDPLENQAQSSVFAYVPATASRLITRKQKAGVIF